MTFRDDNNAEITLSTIAAAAGADRKTAITLNDTTPGDLDTKLTVSGNSITKSVVNPGADERLNLEVNNPVFGDASDGALVITT